MGIDLDAIRAQFPALAMTDDGQRRIYLDNPAGTQTPQRVADAMSDCLLTASANLGGHFPSSNAAGNVVESAREAMADFLNAPSAEEIVFGQNMTTLTLQFSRSIGRQLQEGDEIVVTRMDHDANVWPWVMLAQDLGLEIRWLPFNTETFEFEPDEIDRVLTKRTRLVCVNAASNLTGTINDVASICAKARTVGAWSFVDAVQSAPHIPTDVQQTGCDFLVCSAYKFFGPHQGVLWGRRDVLEHLQPYKLRPAYDEIPWRFETGTQSHEGFAGTAAAIDYFAAIGQGKGGKRRGDWAQFSGRRQDVHVAMDLLFEYEKGLAEHLIAGLGTFESVTVQGITSPAALDRRVPTVSFTVDGHRPDEIARALAAQNIFVWSGHYYAVELARALDIYDNGGAVRVGPVHYNSSEEIDEFLGALESIIA